MNQMPGNSNRMLVVLEAPQGEIPPAALALAGEAWAWARTFDPPLEVWALLLGPVDSPEDILGPHGVAKVLACRSISGGFAPEITARTAAQVALAHDIPWIFCLHDARGPYLGPRLSALLGGTLVSRCLNLVRLNGAWTADQPFHQGHLRRSLTLPADRPRIIAWEPSALGEHPVEGQARAELELQPPVAGDPDISPKASRVIKGDPAHVPLEEADRVVVMGRGLASEGFDRITKLADQLGAVIGATRPIVDFQLLPYERQIGQTGATVAPRLLVACGLSGANEFTVGITGTPIIVAINTDPGASIFQFADLGLVGDSIAIIDHLLNLLSNLGEGIDLEKETWPSP